MGVFATTICKMALSKPCHMSVSACNNSRIAMRVAFMGVFAKKKKLKMALSKP
jgi:hypothetical protein